MSDLLSYAELCEVTGAKRPTKQIQILKASGVSYVVRLDGRLSVTWHSINNARANTSSIQTDGFDLGALSGS